MGWAVVTLVNDEAAAPDPPDALSSVPAAGSRRGTPPVGRLKFCYGPMDCGKSTLALQIDHNNARQGRRGLGGDRQRQTRSPQHIRPVWVIQRAAQGPSGKRREEPVE